ncbi:hypothetical protein N826_34075 [Skermanella aerolata KACC 11604]|nr:hypothetical protein N826_34075 [Skermanella aerolata KACC 11604]
MLDGNQRSVLTNAFPSRPHLYSMKRMSVPYPASEMALAGVGFFTMLLTCRSSTMTTWF